MTVSSASGELGELIDGGAAARVVGDHLLGHGCRISGNAARGDAVIARKYQYRDTFETRHCPSLPTRKPDGHLFKPSQTS